MQVTIDLDKVAQWVDQADSIVLTQDGEKTLKQLLDLQKLLDDAVNQAKKNIEAQALAYNPGFTSITGDVIKITYRAYGGRYTIEKQYQDELPEDLIIREMKIKPNIKAIDTYLEENDGKLPLGLLETEREKQLSIKVLETQNAKV